MDTDFYWHRDAALVAVMIDQDFDTYLSFHPALPSDGWHQVLDGPVRFRHSTPEQLLTSTLYHLKMSRSGVEPVCVFRAKRQPVEVLRYRGPLTDLKNTICDYIAAIRLTAQLAT